MSGAYRLVQWNRHKKVYDLVLAAAVGGYLALFMLGGVLLFHPPNDIAPPILLMRALGTCAIVLLHLILIIGPLHRLTPLAAPLLYNRRHLGVTCFLVALLHALVAVGFYGGFGTQHPALALLTHGSFASATGFPFEWLGLIALLVFFVMAATSHDFWLKNLSPAVWKAIHMAVYPAYALVLGHIALGVIQSEPSPLYPVLMIVGAMLVTGTHLLAGLRERRADRASPATPDGWLDACAIGDIPESRARIVCARGEERIAIFRHGDTVSAVSNVCAHQAGPLGEGRIIDGCITCPWHGYQYHPHSGQSPPPFTEKIPTYEVRIAGDRVLVNPRPLPPGTPVPPAPIPTDG